MAEQKKIYLMNIMKKMRKILLKLSEIGLKQKKIMKYVKDMRKLEISKTEGVMTMSMMIMKTVKIVENVKNREVAHFVIFLNANIAKIS